MRRVGLTLILALFTFPATSQRPKPADKPFAKFSESVLGDVGKDAHLPPHVSQLLGLTTKEQNTNVKQVAFFLKDQEVIAFNVSVQNHKDIVLFRVTPTTMTHFLTSPEGKLRKAVRSAKPSPDAAGYDAAELTKTEANEGFKKEKQCWIDVSQTMSFAPSCGTLASDAHAPASPR